MNHPGPEYRALEKCYPTLVSCLQQSPNDIALHLRPSGVLAPRDIEFLRNPQHADAAKTEKIIDIVMLQSKNDPQLYHTFVASMTNAGKWTKSAVTELERTYTSFTSGCRKEKDFPAKSDVSTESLSGPVTSQPQQATLGPKQSYGQITRNLSDTNPGESIRMDSQSEMAGPRVFSELAGFDEKVADRVGTYCEEEEDTTNNVSVLCTEEPTEVGTYPQCTASQEAPGQQVMSGGNLKLRRISISRELSVNEQSAKGDKSAISQYDEQRLIQELHKAKAEKNQVSEQLKAMENERKVFLNQKRMMDADVKSRITDIEHELRVERSEKNRYKEKCRKLQEKIDRSKQKKQAELSEHRRREAALLMEVYMCGVSMQMQALADQYTKLKRKNAKFNERIAYYRHRESVCFRGTFALSVVCLASILLVLFWLACIATYFVGASGLCEGKH